MKISVAMTTYNGALYVREQLDSILAQTRMPDEVIVCDDQSSDGTLELLKEYSARAPVPMTVVRNEQRLGSTKNFEQAIRLCSGDVIALSDQDDVWRPHKLAVIESTFAADPDLGVVITNADLIDKQGAEIRGDLWSRFMFDKSLQEAMSGSQRYDLLLGWCFATGATMAFRSRFNAVILPIPSEAPTFVHDRWIAVTIAAAGRFAIIPERLIAYRLHPAQQLGVGKAPFPLRHLTPFRCHSDAVALAALDERFKANPLRVSNPDFERSLVERQRHIEARSKFSRNPVRRLKQVASEYGSGRYNLYPIGFKTCLKDLVVGTR